MQKRDLQQISSLLDQKLDQKFKENNKKIEKIIDKKIDEVIVTSKAQFDEHTRKFDEHTKRLNKMDENLAYIKEELEKKPTKEDLFGWADKQMTPVKLDVDKLKYIHRDAWQDLPDGGTVSRVLITKRIK